MPVLSRVVEGVRGGNTFPRGECGVLGVAGVASGLSAYLRRVREADDRGLCA